MNLYLIGYRGSGKTTVGRLLADELGWPFLDTDAEIEKNAGRPIREIFSEQGEEEFRRLESEAILATIQLNETIISLGGGACQRKANRETIRSGGKSAWLTGDAETLWERISADLISDEQRPDLTGLGGLEEVKQLLEQRHENYAACADYKIETRELQPHEVAAQIVRWWNSVDKK